MTVRTEEFLGELRLGRQLTSSGQVAAGGAAILGGLLFVLVGRVTSLTGAWAGLAGLVAGIALGLNLLNLLELLGGSGERGGTYVLIHETLGGLAAFVAGWSILAGSLMLSAALALATADHVLLLFPALQAPAPQIALILLMILALTQLLQLLPGRPLLRPVLVVLAVAGAIAILSTLHQVDTQRYGAYPTITPGDLTRSGAWLMAGYLIFEAMLASRRQMREPRRHLPVAMFGTLIAGSLTFALLGLVAAGLSSSITVADTALASLLGEASFLPAGLISFLAVCALTLATNGSLMTAARQMHALSREGALPAELRRVRGQFPMPPLLFGTLTLATASLIVWVPVWWLVQMAAGLLLITMTLLNVAVIHSHQTEPERRRLLVLPFYPLLPALAIASNLVLLAAIPLARLLGMGVWVLAGLGVYVVYSRRHQVEAQEGVVVFGRERRREDEEEVYRILVPLSPAEERHLLLRLATALAHQLDGEVVPLQVITMSDPLAIEQGRRIAQERNTLFQWSTRLGEDVGVPMYPITRLARNVPEGILDTATEEDCDLILMPWAVERSAQGARMGHVVDPVVRRAPCDVAVVAYHSEDLGNQTVKQVEEISGAEGAWQPSSLLVPTAGGPHAPLAVHIALLLAREYDATVTAIYVTPPDASDEEVEQGQEYIEQTIATMRDQSEAFPSLNGHGPPLDEIPIESRVIKAEGVVSGIATAGTDAGLVLMGASEESVIDQVLFGNVPEQVARQCSTPVVMVKHYRGLPRLWLQRTWDTLYETLPTLSVEEQVDVYKQVRRGARPDIDFFVMIGLSAIIATVGLLQNSSAVIIGAMLVAPLFTPILGLSLAIVQGDVRLLRLAVESTLKGVFLAVGLSVVLALPSPLQTVTSEVLARTEPSLFDLVVALGAGAAGAYAFVREDVAAALPGVAIAAALVPPISVAGIGLAMGDPDIAGGGGLLFTTNLIAITLAGAIMLLLLGFQPTRRGEREARLRVGLVTTVVLLVLITIPLAAVFAQSVSESQTAHAIEQALQEHVQPMPGVLRTAYEFQDLGNEVEVTVTVYARRSVATDVAERLQGQLRQSIGKPVRLRFVTIPITEINVPPG